MASVVQSPRRVQHVNEVVSKLETGDLRLRVRVLESEAAFARMEATQGSLTAAVMASLFLNAGVALASSATVGPAVAGSRVMYVLAGFFGLQVPIGYLKVMLMLHYSIRPSLYYVTGFVCVVQSDFEGFVWLSLSSMTSMAPASRLTVVRSSQMWYSLRRFPSASCVELHASGFLHDVVPLM